MTNRIRYWNHVLLAAVIVELTGLMWNASWGSFQVGGKAFTLMCSFFPFLIIINIKAGQNPTTNLNFTLFIVNFFTLHII